MFRSLFYHLQAEYTIFVFGNYYINKQMYIPPEDGHIGQKHVVAVRNRKRTSIEIAAVTVFTTILIIHAIGCSTQK
jgi:hypothetical protein